MSLIIKNILRTIILTTIIIVSFIIISDKSIYTSDIILIEIIVVFLSFSLPNTLFLVLFNYFKKGSVFFENWKFLIVEIIFLFSFFLFIEELHKSLPDKINILNIEKPYFSFYTELVIVFLFLIIVMIIMEKYLPLNRFRLNKKNTIKNGTKQE